MVEPRQNNSPARARVRCAVYTRKSSEEGLEQEFNSLDAQREACEAYVTSQKHEGWTTLATLYDDGAYSGGTMDRPALQRLAGRRTRRQDRRGRRLQGRSADAIAGGFRQDRRGLRRARRIVRVGHASVQYDEQHGPPHAQCACSPSPSSSGGHGRAHPRSARRRAAVLALGCGASAMRVQPGRELFPCRIADVVGDARTERWLRQTAQSETPVPPKVGFET